MTQITVTGVVGEAKVVTVNFTVTETGAQESAKAFRNDYMTEEPAWVVGQSYGVDFEEKNNEWQGKITVETWIKKGKYTQSGASGTKPASTGSTAPRTGYSGDLRRGVAVLAKEDYLLKWDHERAAKTITDSSIVAQVILKCAVELAVESTKYETHADGISVNLVQGFANDLAGVYASTQATIFQTLKGYSAGEE